MSHCCSPSVRQSAFALVGELAKATPSQVPAVAPHCVSLAAAMLEAPRLGAENVGAANNACWASGELAMASAASFDDPSATALAERLVAILSANRSVNSALYDNAAIALGRLAAARPAPLAPHLEQFLAPFCFALGRIRDAEEKEHAFAGLFRLVRLKPEALGAGIVPLAFAIASWRQVANLQLRAEMREVLGVYRAGVAPEQWESLLANLGSGYQERVLALIA